MEVFEVHITGDEAIHAVAAKEGLKTIAIDLLKPDGSVLRTEHMTSHVYRFENYDRCSLCVQNVVNKFEIAGVRVIRVKIESPYYEHYRAQSLYMESHFQAEDFKYPTSKNQRKTTLLATDRTEDKTKYEAFKNQHKGNELELCLYDSFQAEDKDWFDHY